MMPWGTDMTGLVAEFETDGCSVTVDGVEQAGGVTANDFTSPLTYRVTAEDGSTVDYTVTVSDIFTYTWDNTRSDSDLYPEQKDVYASADGTRIYAATGGAGLPGATNSCSYRTT